MIRHILIGATHRDAVAWCDEHLIHRSEIGRTVFASRMHREDTLRGRPGRYVFVTRLPSDPRDFAEELNDRDLWMIRMGRQVNFSNEFRGQWPA